MFEFSQVSVAAISFILSWYLTYNWTIVDRRIHVSLFDWTVGRRVASWVKSTAVGLLLKCASCIIGLLSVVPLTEDTGVMMTHLFIIGLFVSRTSDRRYRCDDDASFHHRPFVRVC